MSGVGLVWVHSTRIGLSTAWAMASTVCLSVALSGLAF